MAEQDFLAAYGVQIDEEGVHRLHSILEENRQKAAEVSGAFAGAETALQGWLGALSGDLPEGLAAPVFALELDLSRAAAALAAFMSSASSRFRLSADPSGLLSTAAAALEEIEALFAGARLSLKVQPEMEEPSGGEGGKDGEPGAPKPPGGDTPLPKGLETPGTPDAPELPNGPGLPASPVLPEEPSVSDEIRILEFPDMPEIPEIPEIPEPSEGSEMPKAPEEPELPEWPEMPDVRNRQADPLVISVPNIVLPEQIIPEIPSPEITIPENPFPEILLPETAQPDSPLPEAQSPKDAPPGLTLPEISWPELSGNQALAPSPAPAETPRAGETRIEAPVTIQVTAAGTDPEALGESIYRIAQRYQLRTLRPV